MPRKKNHAREARRQPSPRPSPVPWASPPPRDLGSDTEKALRQRLEDQIIKTFTPLLTTVLVGYAAGEEKWDQLAQEPVPAEILRTVPALRDELRREIAKLGITEDEVKHWLGKALQVRQIQREVKTLKKSKPPPLAFDKQVTAARKLLQGAWWLRPPAREALEADVRRMEEVALPLLESVDRAIKRLAQADVFGKTGRPRGLDIRLAAKGLADLMRKRTGEPRVGLVAALLKDAQLLPHTGCWTPAPTLSPNEQEKMWCRRARKRRPVCPRDPLR